MPTTFGVFFRFDESIYLLCACAFYFLILRRARPFCSSVSAPWFSTVIIIRAKFSNAGAKSRGGRQGSFVNQKRFMLGIISSTPKWLFTLE
jgi:hypothetical protein